MYKKLKRKFTDKSYFVFTAARQDSRIAKYGPCLKNLGTPAINLLFRKISKPASIVLTSNFHNSSHLHNFSDFLQLLIC